ncbi:hypothetical protein DFR86_05060 [Acidianus sulfidivorans JP7]|uniref:Uncharacterized protein n=1 Tax=Acidianus sulfidivorans JP7 TaxID=619593 RepID=A0A2U9ILV8_9CREN|nr:hypothetical protein [Acidianus sulfidivorans]AWR96990.1 hypothetical protein DFR86_05060 [Acidianus sulfidivorans JP7]
MSSTAEIGKTSLRWAAMLLSALWAGVHLDLTSAVLPNPTATLIYRIFFGFTSALAIVAAVAFIQGIKKLYFPAMIFFIIDFILLTETRTAPALFVGKVLPVNPYVEISLALDIILIALSAVLWRIDRK